MIRSGATSPLVGSVCAPTIEKSFRDIKRKMRGAVRQPLEVWEHTVLFLTCPLSGIRRAVHVGVEEELQRMPPASVRSLYVCSFLSARRFCSLMRTASAAASENDLHGSNDGLTISAIALKRSFAGEPVCEASSTFTA